MKDITLLIVIVTVIELIEICTLVTVIPEFDELGEQEEGAVIVGGMQVHPLYCWQLDEHPS